MTEKDRDSLSSGTRPTDDVAGHRARAPWLVGITGLALAAVAIGWAIVRMT
ncbi:MAG: hypothetical protein JO055_02585 [Alphaproteobacteria bacterium]|nr:hypothetical protein [Alphaproteobacteria bacterium]